MKAKCLIAKCGLTWAKSLTLIFALHLTYGSAPEARAALNVTISTGTTTGGSFSSGVWTPTASPSRINVNDLISVMSAGTTVTIQTNAAGAEAGDITIATTIPFNNITGTSARTLTLNATNDVLINAAMDQSGSSGVGSPNPVNVNCNANSDSSGGGSTTQAADVNTGGGRGHGRRHL